MSECINTLIVTFIVNLYSVYIYIYTYLSYLYVSMIYVDDTLPINVEASW